MGLAILEKIYYSIEQIGMILFKSRQVQGVRELIPESCAARAYTRGCMEPEAAFGECRAGMLTRTATGLRTSLCMTTCLTESET